MSVREILTEPDPRLRDASAPVVSFDRELENTVRDLTDTLKHSGAIGLSAPQIGIARQVLIVHVPDDPYGHRVYINPRVLSTRRPGYIEESCLSVPGIAGSVMRPTLIHLRYEDEQGVTHECEREGLHAVCVQHEIDHLQGVLFTDRLAWFSRWRLRLTGALQNQPTQAA